MTCGSGRELCGSRRSFIGVASALFAMRTLNASDQRAADATFGDVEEPLLPLAEKLGAPEPGDWLAEHHEEGQTFSAYVRSQPVRKSDRLKTIYISTLGEIPVDQKEVVNLVGEYLSLFFSTPVKSHQQWGLAELPREAMRKNPGSGEDQILTTYVLNDLLRPTRPADALAYLALTAVDLWPGMKWNFVFGQGSLRDRTGIWSTARNGDASGSDAERTEFLRRTLKTAAHETMHLLSMPHCKEFVCVLNGSNNRDEFDRKPLRPCPTCERKLSWNLRESPADRYRKLADFCQRHEFTADALSFTKAH